MLQIIDLSKSYKNKQVLNNISLEVNKGEIFGFIGHNGAGKTTTIKSVVGIHSFEQGDILINGKSIKENPVECKKEIAYVPDNPDIYEYLTGIQYLNFISNVCNIQKREREERIKYYAKQFEIESILGNLISTYSHGTKQKLVLVSALIRNPKILILDEPFVGLDPKASFTLKKFMREFCEKGGCIFFSTHMLEVAEKICDKVGIIINGKLIIYGTTNEVIKDKSLENIFMELFENE